MGRWRFILPLLAVAGASAQRARAGEFDIPYHPTRIIVRFRAETTSGARAQAHGTVPGARPIWQSAITDGLQIVEVPAAEVPAAVLAYRRQPSVLYVEPGYAITLFDTPDDPDDSEPCDYLWGLKGGSLLPTNPPPMCS